MQIHWEAEMVDGSVVSQYSGGVVGEGHEESTAVIDRSILKVFRMMKDGERFFEAHFDPSKPGRKLVFRRRTRVSTDGTRNVVYLVGWHENVKGVSIKSLCYIYEDGHIEFDDDRNDLQLFPFETDEA